MAIYEGNCVYEVKFFVPEVPSKMYTIIDAETGEIRLIRDELTTLPKFEYERNFQEDSTSGMENLPETHQDSWAGKGGTGPGGNAKIGKHQYGTSAYGFLRVTRSGSRCIMENSDVVVYDCHHAQSCSHSTPYSYTCPQNTHKEINGAYSPLNDALYYGNIAFDMFLKWTGVRIVDKVIMGVHLRNNYENAFHNGKGVYFGDGRSTFHPLSTDLGVIAHELGHWFTASQSNLVYAGMSGGLNEAFSDMAAIAANVYAKGTDVDFMVGPDAFKQRGKALRYMKNPPQDGRSIDHASQFKNWMNVHYTSGVFNKAFYFLSTTNGWNVEKAFKVMARANVKYWSKNTNWNSAGDGAIDAACDLGHNTEDVRNALARVGITSQVTSGKQCGGGTGPDNI